MDDIEPEDYVAEKNLNYKEMSVSEGVGKDDETIKMSNVPSLTGFDSGWVTFLTYETLLMFKFKVP